MLEYLAVVGVMFAGIYACTRLLVWFVFGTPPRLLVPLIDYVDARRRRPPEPVPPVLHELELARLARELRRVREANQPGLATRVRACTAAYDDVLLACAHDIGVPAPQSRPPLSTQERFEVETRLMAAGLRW
ncbi:hypothetical protein [Piscicoccus intestinalis]|uniref:hypothetical protein n=1 Tax=Piscicoccus intestinalis TaxID=746033 RepID=UPI0008380450|nr:hypothetical protein [Piscicoccus intestinalis]